MTTSSGITCRPIVAASAALAASLFTLPAVAANNNIANGVHTQFCQVNWSSRSVLKSDILINPGPWGNYTSDVANGYSNNGFLEAVGYDVGVLRVDHWFGPPVQSVNNPTPDPAPANTSMFWRMPVGSNWTVQNAQAVVTLPSVTGIGNVNVSTAFAAWSFPSGYTAALPMPSVTTPVGGGATTFPLGTLTGNTGLFLNFNAPIATGWDRAQGVQASIVFTGAYIRGNPGDPATAPTCIYSTQASDESLGSVGPGGGTTGSVLANDQGSDGKPAVGGPGGNVVLTPGPTPVAGMSMNPNGTVTVAPNTEPGVYSFSYKICPAQDPAPAPAPDPSTCSTATASITVTAPPAPVPTLGGWAVLALAGLLAGLGLRRRAA